MKKELHPNAREVLFTDSSAGVSFLTLSTVKTKETAEYEGKEYPAVKVEISSASHPFYTGTQKVLDTEGRIDRFKKRYAKLTKN